MHLPSVIPPPCSAPKADSPLDSSPCAKLSRRPAVAIPFFQERARRSARFRIVLLSVFHFLSPPSAKLFRCCRYRRLWQIRNLVEDSNGVRTQPLSGAPVKGNVKFLGKENGQFAYKPEGQLRDRGS